TAGLTLIPKLGNSPDAFGSGKSGYPFSRMHAANFTALSRAVGFLLPPVPALLAVAVSVVPLSADPFEQPAVSTASMARAASGQSVLVMVSPLVCRLHRHRFSAERAFGAEFLVPDLVAVDPAQPADLRCGRPWRRRPRPRPRPGRGRAGPTRPR